MAFKNIQNLEKLVFKALQQANWQTHLNNRICVYIKTQHYKSYVYQQNTCKN